MHARKRVVVRARIYRLQKKSISVNLSEGHSFRCAVKSLENNSSLLPQASAHPAKREERHNNGFFRSLFTRAVKSQKNNTSSLPQTSAQRSEALKITFLRNLFIRAAHDRL